MPQYLVRLVFIDVYPLCLTCSVSTSYADVVVLLRAHGQLYGLIYIYMHEPQCVGLGGVGFKDMTKSDNLGYL